MASLYTRKGHAQEGYNVYTGGDDFHLIFFFFFFLSFQFGDLYLSVRRKSPCSMTGTCPIGLSFLNHGVLMSEMQRMQNAQ